MLVCGNRLCILLKSHADERIEALVCQLEAHCGPFLLFFGDLLPLHARSLPFRSTICFVQKFLLLEKKGGIAGVFHCGEYPSHGHEYILSALISVRRHLAFLDKNSTSSSRRFATVSRAGPFCGVVFLIVISPDSSVTLEVLYRQSLGCDSRDLSISSVAFLSLDCHVSSESAIGVGTGTDDVSGQLCLIHFSQLSNENDDRRVSKMSSHLSGHDSLDDEKMWQRNGTVGIVGKMTLDTAVARWQRWRVEFSRKSLDNLSALPSRFLDYHRDAQGPGMETEEPASCHIICILLDT